MEIFVYPCYTNKVDLQAVLKSMENGLGEAVFKAEQKRSMEKCRTLKIFYQMPILRKDQHPHPMVPIRDFILR